MTMRGGSSGRGRASVGEMLERMKQDEAAGAAAEERPAPGAGPEATAGGGSGPAGLEGAEMAEADLRLAAEAQGYTLMRRPTRRGVRPQEIAGKVKMSQRIDGELRRVLEQYRLQTNRSYDDIFNSALRSYLLEQGFRVELGTAMERGS